LLSSSCIVFLRILFEFVWPIMVNHFLSTFRSIVYLMARLSRSGWQIVNAFVLIPLGARQQQVLGLIGLVGKAGQVKVKMTSLIG